MKASLDDRIARATELAEIHPAARGLLSFYRELALFQKPVYEELQSEGGTDIRVLVRHFPALLDLVRRIGPAPLAEFGGQHLQSRSEEHTSELQSQSNLVCRLLLEKKKKKQLRISLLKKKKKTRK